MKNLYFWKGTLLIAFLTSSLSILAQENRQNLLQTYTTTTTWDGKKWDNGFPNLLSKAVFNADFRGTENLDAQAVEIRNEAKVTFSDNAILRVLDDIIVSPTAKLSFDENAQLVQTNPNARLSSMTFSRKTRKINKFDYTYFCSPVDGQILNQITDFTVDVTNYTNEGGAYALPLFDKYFFFNQNATPDPFYANAYNSGNWQNVSETSTMDPAERGFIIRGPQSFAPLPAARQEWFVQFTGVPHNDATYTVPVSGMSYTPCSNLPAITKVSPNFIGNPYPSMIDADLFLSNSSNVANLNGAIYLWTHNSAPAPIPGDATLNYTADDFTIYNLVGGIGTGRVVGDPIYAPNGYNRPNGKIAMCQGFITYGINANNGIATFTNAMRDNSLNGTPNNQQFFGLLQVVQLLRLLLKIVFGQVSKVLLALDRLIKKSLLVIFLQWEQWELRQMPTKKLMIQRF